MFERFTDRARRVVVLAQEEARMLDHNYIGTEHILLGLIHEGEGVAAKALESLGISLEAVRQQVEQIIGRGKQAPASGRIPFTPRAKKVLELSLREALQLNHNYIGTEHILLGLIREGEGVAAQALVQLGADLDRVRRQVVRLLHDQEGSPETRGPFSVSRSGERGEILKTLTAISDRLAAIERYLGLAKPPAAGAAAETAAAGAAAEAHDPAPAGDAAPAGDPAPAGTAAPDDAAAGHATQDDAAAGDAAQAGGAADSGDPEPPAGHGEEKSIG
jgi:Clp amino terminal domain, pathogenicity island component